MLNLLVAVGRSLEASFALRTACLFGGELNIQPIYVFDPPGRDIAFGAGWARKSWERETSRRAEENIEDLVSAERNQCPYIHDPLVMNGDPFQEPAEKFWAGKYDLLVVGAPFRGAGPLALCRRFGHAARKARRPLPLMVVRHLHTIERIIALTDGSAPSENTLGLLLHISAHVSGRITLLGMRGEKASDAQAETLHLERGLAILNEKGIQAESHRVSELEPKRLTAMLKGADLLVNPVDTKDPHHFFNELPEDDIHAVLLHLDGR